MGLPARSLLVLALVLAPAVATAQSGGAPAAPSTGNGNAPETAAPAGNGAPAAGGSAEAGDAPKKSSSGAAGYAFTDKPAPRKHAVLSHKAGPTATLPGFEQLSDGGSRLFVQLTQQVPVEERRTQASVTYVLKGAHVRLSNNTNALVTVHFNTPVWRARLVPQGKDLLFVLDLRAAAAPTWRMDAGKGGGASLVVDFARGDFLGAPAPTETTAAKASGAAGPDEAAARARGKKRAPKKSPPDAAGAPPAGAGEGTGPTP